MSGAPFSSQQVQEIAKNEVMVGGDTLVISKVHVRILLVCLLCLNEVDFLRTPQLWRNDQPRPMTVAEEVEESTHQTARPAHVTLTIRRKENQTGENLTDSALPYIVALHILRTNESTGLTLPPTETPEPDAPNSAHFAWPAPPEILAATELTDQDASAGGFFLARSVDGGAGLTLSAWDGPRWGCLRNGIDDTIGYNAVVEFQSGIFLKSGKERMMVVH